MKQWKHICLKWNEFIKRILRKESIFKRLNLSFLGLLLGAAAFITFFSFDKYSKEIIWGSEAECGDAGAKHLFEDGRYYAGI